MGDVDDGHAVRLQILDNAEQGFDLVGGQGGSGLIQNEYLTVGGNGLGDFHGLHLGNAQLSQHLLGIKVHPNLFQKLGGIGVHLLVVNHGDEAQQLLHGVAAQENILADGTGGNGLQLLMHHGDAHFQSFQRVLNGDLLALVNNLALVHAVDAEHTLHQCGFTGTVFAHQSMNLTGAQTKLGMIQRLNTGKGLTNTAHFQAVFTHRADLLSYCVIQDFSFRLRETRNAFQTSLKRNPLKCGVGCKQPTRKGKRSNYLVTLT